MTHTFLKTGLWQYIAEQFLWEKTSQTDVLLVQYKTYIFFKCWKCQQKYYSQIYLKYGNKQFRFQNMTDWALSYTRPFDVTYVSMWE